MTAESVVIMNRGLAMRVAHRSLIVLLGAFAGTSVACAHVVTADGAAERTARDGLPERVFVTGSRIPQRVDPRTGIPLTTSPVQIYSRQQLDETGRQTDLAAALKWLDPIAQ